MYIYNIYIFVYILKYCYIYIHGSLLIYCFVWAKSFLAALTGGTCICFVPTIFGYAGGRLSQFWQLCTTLCKITLA